MFKRQYPFLNEVDSLALANKQMDLQRVFCNFFDKKHKKRRTTHTDVCIAQPVYSRPGIGQTYTLAERM